MAHRIAVIGATGNIGREILQILAERNWPVSDIVAVASERSAGGQVSYGEEEDLTVQDLARFNFQNIKLAFFACTPKVAEQYVPMAIKAGSIVIDCSGQFHLDPNVPLVIPEINGEVLKQIGQQKIIANPQSLSIALALVIHPLQKVAKVRRAVVSTYQSASGLGKSAMDELFTQTRAIYVNDPIVKENFTKQIAFNVIPHVSAFMEDGNTRCEWETMAETKKMFGPDIKVSATCVQVPVFIGHALAVNLELEEEISASEARKLLRQQEGITVIDHRADEGYVTPVECAGDDPVFVSRIREDISVENGLNLWLVIDNLRKGAALNAVQIAELLRKQF